VIEVGVTEYTKSWLKVLIEVGLAVMLTVAPEFPTEPERAFLSAGSE
jgi:hypothetical protein